MTTSIPYLIDRLREPGTLRSLAVVLFALKGLLPEGWGLGGVASPEAVQDFISALLVLLGGWSALMPEKGAQAVAAVQEAASTAHTAAREAKAMMGNAAQVLDSARKLGERAVGARS